MKYVMWLLFLAGCYLGPGLYLYEHALSGTPIKTVEVFGKVKTPAGPIERQFKTPVTLHLTPAMNPITIDISAQSLPASPDSYGELDQYHLTLTRDDETVWSRDWSIGFRKGRKASSIPRPAYSGRLGRLNVPAEGDYTFDMKLADDRGAVRVDGFTLHVLSKVYEQPSWAFITGLALFLGVPAIAYFRITRSS